MKSKCNVDLWHQRLGHVHVKWLEQAVNNDLIADVDVSRVSWDADFCEACVQAKQTRKPFEKWLSVQTTQKTAVMFVGLCLFHDWVDPDILSHSPMIMSVSSVCEQSDSKRYRRIFVKSGE